MDELIGRRTALKYFAFLAGSEAGREFLAGWLPSAPAAESAPHSVGAHALGHSSPSTVDSSQPYIPRFFRPEEFKTVELLTEMIIPTDDKPGAREAGVANYIDFVAFSAAEFEPSLQMKWTSGLALLDKTSKDKYGRIFRELLPAEREEMLIEMSRPERDPAASHPGFDFYRLVKETTVEGFYTSRIGLIEVLEYEGLSFLSEFPGCTHPEHQ